MSAREPMRLIDPGAGAEPELAAALRAWRSERGSDAQVHALRTRLGSELAAHTVAGSAVAKLFWIKLLLGGLVPLAVGWLALGDLARPVAKDAETRSSVDATSVATSPAPAVPPRSASSPGPASEVQASEVQASALPAPPPPPHPAARATPMRAQPPRAASPAPERELALLQRAQAALDRAPQTVLALTAEHERDHPQGIFAQEREILAIEALLKLGRRAAAHARAERFVQRFVGSPHTRRVRALLERTPAPKAQTIERSIDDTARNVEP